MYKNFHHQFPIQLRFKDLDALGHVNNANYLSYVELGRLDYFKTVNGVDLGETKEGIILAKATVDFKLPVYMKDEMVVFTRCCRIGTKSLDLEYEICKKTADGYVTAATASTVLVTMNYGTGKTVPVPDEWKQKITAFEGTKNLQ